MLRFILASALFLALSSTPAGAQAVRGRIVDLVTNSLIEGAEVTLVDTAGATIRRAMTGADGRFAFQNVGPGALTVHVTALGYAAGADRRVEHRGEPLFLEIGLRPAPVGQQGIVVTVTAQNAHLRSVGFYDRLKRGHGDFVSPEDVARLTVIRPSGLLRRVGSLKVVSGREPVFIRSQGFGGGPLDCVPNLYIDGVAVRLRTSLENLWDPDAFDNVIPPAEDIEAIEVYPGGASMPAQWRSSNSSCGAIAVWTKH